MRSGYITASLGFLRYTGTYGYNWSEMSSSKRYSEWNVLSAYGLYFNLSETNPSPNPYDRWNGLPLRCLKYALKFSKILRRVTPIKALLRSNSLSIYRGSIVKL